MNAIPLVRASVFLPIVEFLNSIGSPTDKLLTGVDLVLLSTGDPESLLPLYQASELLENASQLEGIDNLGDHQQRIYQLRGTDENVVLR